MFADFISQDSKIVETDVDRGNLFLFSIFSLGTGSQERGFRGEQYMCVVYVIFAIETVKEIFKESNHNKKTEKSGLFREFKF